MTSTIARAQTAKGNSNPLASPPRATTTTTTSLSTSASANGPTLLHAHRQSHTPSKLPAFRFTDRKRESTIIAAALISASVGAPNTDQEAQGLGTEHEPDHHVPLTPDPTNTHTTPNNPAHTFPTQEKQNESGHQAAQHQRQSFLAASPRSRASTFQSSGASPQTSVKRPLSFPHTPLAAATQHASTPSAAPVGASSSSVTKSPSATPIAKPHAPRSAVSSSASNAIDCTSDPSTSLSSKRLLAVDASQSSEPSEKIKEWAQGQRELLLPKSLDSNSFESTQLPPPKRSNTDEKKPNVARRPPVSFKPPPGATAPSTPGKPVIPPIRAFRSSGSRRSVVLDMNIRNARPDNADDADGSSHRDRTLRALEGRHNDDPLQSTPPDSAAGADDGDMFLRIARQEFARKTSDEGREGSTGSRITRTSSHRRPYSAAIPTYQPISPPRISRRLSDQQETKRSRAYDDDHIVAVDGILRPTGHREAMSSTQEHSRTRTSTSGLKPAPTTPRTLTFQDQESPSSYNRRRGSITENGPTRPAYKNSSLSYSKTYNPSPLVPRQDSTDTSHGFEGTESTSSTNAPSVMWDEVEKMSSQIQRMQMKGSLPASSSAISRASDERPPTATTTVTTMSTSPKRASGNSGYHAADASSTTSSLKEPHPILHAALAKTKSVVSPEVYQALETTATDAMALAGMMGIAGQPGPISSGASSIGNGMTLTDRQLRRKADSVCRSLTELCIALTEDASRKSPPATVIQSIEKPERETVMSPTATNFLSAPPARRPSAVEMPINLTASPRTTTRLEDRRTVINGSALPSPRFNTTSAAEPVSAGRKSSLLITRTRRAGTEEPEDGRRSSVLFRSRRAGTEEPDEGRKSSLLVRNRRNTNGDDDEETSRFRAPSRATTDLGGLRALNRDREAVAGSSGDATLGASALPRRRLPPSSLGSSRLAAPATTPTSSRRYIDRQTPDRETTVNDKIERERSQTQYLQRPTALLGRSGSLSRRNRESAMSGVSTTATAGGYR